MSLKIYERLSAISFSRPSGTDKEKEVAAFLEKEIKKIGFEPEVETFEYTRKVPKKATLTAIYENGEERSFSVTGVIDSSSTPEEGITAELYYLSSFDDVSLGRIKGKVVLIHDRLSPKTYRKLKEAGIVSYITTSGTIRDTYENSDLETVRFRDNLLDIGAVPAFTIRMIDAVELLKSYPQKVRVTLSLKEEKVESQNLLVKVQGTEYPEEILVAGAHYDSVPFSKGSWDNGAGTVEILSLLEHLKDHPGKRTVYTVWFGSEETGLQGSKAFVKRHEKELGKILGMVNVDVGGSILGKEIVFVTAIEKAVTWVEHLVKEAGYPANPGQHVMSSDSAVFSDHGIPSISLGQGAPRGGGYMHTRYDNMDLIDEKILEKEAGFLIRIVDRLANSIVFPIPRVIPEKLRDDLIEYFSPSRSAQSELPAIKEEKISEFHF